jgi:hypothetical protein
MALAPAHAPGQLPSLAEPVTFTGPDAEQFLGELAPELTPAAKSRLRESVAAATAAMSSKPANALFQ